MIRPGMCAISIGTVDLYENVHSCKKIAQMPPGMHVKVIGPVELVGDSFMVPVVWGAVERPGWSSMKGAVKADCLDLVVERNENEMRQWKLFARMLVWTHIHRREPRRVRAKVTKNAKPNTREEENYLAWIWARWSEKKSRRSDISGELWLAFRRLQHRMV